MKSTLVIAPLSAVLLVVAASGCRPAPLAGPPELRLGREECRECGMIISEDRCSSALVEERQGRREHVMFDDIACMLDYERESLDGAVVIERWVHDHGSRQWVRADSAAFLAAPPKKLVTPMSSGMVAFASKASAEDLRGRHGGDLMDYPGLTAARADWDRLRRAPTTSRAGD